MYGEDSRPTTCGVQPQGLEAIGEDSRPTTCGVQPQNLVAIRLS